MTEHLSIKGVRRGDAVVVNQPLPNLLLREGEIGEVVVARMYSCRVKFSLGRKLDVYNNFLDRIVAVADEDPDPQADGINRGRIAEKTKDADEKISDPETDYDWSAKEIDYREPADEEEYGLQSDHLDVWAFESNNA